MCSTMNSSPLGNGLSLSTLLILGAVGCEQQPEPTQTPAQRPAAVKAPSAPPVSCPVLDETWQASLTDGHQRMALLAGGEGPEDRRLAGLLTDSFAYPSNNICQLSAGDEARLPAVWAALQDSGAGDQVLVLLSGEASGWDVRMPLEGVLKGGATLSVLVDAVDTQDPDGLARHLRELPGTSVTVGISEQAGAFTAAALTALGEAGGAMDYGSLGQRAFALMSARGHIPRVEGAGDMSAPVFGGAVVDKPLTYAVTAVSAGEIELAGPGLVGWSKGARVALYGGDITRAQLADVQQANAALRGFAELQNSNPYTVRAQLDPSAEGVKVGDLAMLDTPGPVPFTLAVQLQQEGEGAIAPELLARVQEELSNGPQASLAVELVTDTPDFLVQELGDELVLVDRTGVLRSRYPLVDDRAPERRLARTLDLFARQNNWLGQRAGARWADELLKVRLVENTDLSRIFCPITPFRERAEGEPAQRVPLCTGMTLLIEYRDLGVADSFPDGLHLGVLWLGNDGNIYTNAELGFDDSPLQPGEVREVPLTMATPPVGLLDHVLVVGTPREMDWSQVAAETVRGIGGPGDIVEEDAWTMSYLPVQVTGARVQTDRLGRVVLGVGAGEVLWSDEQLNDPKVCNARHDAMQALQPLSPACPRG